MNAVLTINLDCVQKIQGRLNPKFWEVSAGSAVVRLGTATLSVQ